QYGVCTCVLQPDLAVDVRTVRAHLIDLDVRAVQLRRQAPQLERLRLAIELRDAALELHPEPQVFFAVEADAENAGGRFRLQDRHGELGDGRGSRIELAEDLLAKAGVPGDAARVDDDVVRLAGLVRQVVLGIDDLRRLPRRSRRCLERIAPLGSGAQIERRQVLGLAAPGPGALLGGL